MVRDVASGTAKEAKPIWPPTGGGRIIEHHTGAPHPTASAGRAHLPIPTAGPKLVHRQRAA